MVRECHGVVALGVVRAEEQRDFVRRYRIRQVYDCGVIGAELLEVSLVKLAPAAAGSVETLDFLALPSPREGTSA
jgi:hypothetical protein